MSYVSSSEPKTVDVGAVEVETKGVPQKMPAADKLTHALAIVIASVIAVAVTAVLADGSSVIKLKDAQFLPIATNPDLRSQGLYHRADQLLGPTYGIGLHHDQSGRSWTKMGAGKNLKTLLDELGTPVVIAALPSVISTDGLKHPVPFLSCDDLQMAGLCAASFGFIAEIVACLMVIFHTLALGGLLPAKIVKPAAALIWATLTAGFLIVILLAVGIYTATWTCHNIFIPKLRLSDHFEFNYAWPYAIIGYLSALLVTLAILLILPMDGVSAPGKPMAVAGKGVVGYGIMVVVAVAASLIVCGGNNAFKDAGVYGPVDPDVNPCAGKQRYHAGPGDNYFANVDCMKDNLVQVLEQAGANVTKGYRGGMNPGDRVPITVPYSQTDLCPVNVHWHLGAEHLSEGQFDNKGTGPANDGGSASDSGGRRQLAGSPMTLGRRCHHYDNTTEIFTKPYNWQHCTNMMIGETYEIHWPHSAAGACGTKWQYQTPFYDGVFCNDGIVTIAPLNTYQKIGVQAQIFTVVNSDDPAHYYPNLIDGMLVDASKGQGQDIAMYTGSTTGTSRNNVVCSRYTPITWQVDRTCHMISASSFDKLCQDMSAKEDDMSGDYYPHGARELVATHLVANNQQSRK